MTVPATARLAMQSFKESRLERGAAMPVNLHSCQGERHDSDLEGVAGCDIHLYGMPESGKEHRCFFPAEFFAKVKPVDLTVAIHILQILHVIYRERN